MASTLGTLALQTSLDIEVLRARVEKATASALLSAGVAHRVVLAAMLLRAGSTTISGEEIARALGLSRAAVNKHVGHLRDLGFAVRSTPGAGYLLERPFDDLVAAEAVLPFLLGARSVETPWLVGLPYMYLPSHESTNLGLKRLAASRADTRSQPSGEPVTPGEDVSSPGLGELPSGALMLTDEQTGGRGRLGRVWSSEAAKDLTFSVFLRPSLAPAQAHLLSLTAALAVAEVLEALPGLDAPVMVKWPNDVLLRDDKVCGILFEGSIDDDRLQWAVAGMGLNVNSRPSSWLATLPPQEADAWTGRPRPVSLRERLGRDVPRAPLLAAILGRLTDRWRQLERRSEAEATTAAGAGIYAEDTVAGAGGVLAALRRRDALSGRQVEILAAPTLHEPAVAGEAMGIGSQGQLLVRRSSGDLVEVFAGDVTVRTASQGS